MAGGDYKATVKWAGDDFFIGTPPSGHALTIDSKGDRRAAYSPLEMLLVSVAACTAADVISILEKKRQKVTAYDVQVFTAFHVHHIVQGHDVSEQAVEHAVELSDQKYCSVAATVRPTADITTSFEVINIS
jgi:putative redox protein